MFFKSIFFSMFIGRVFWSPILGPKKMVYPRTPIVRSRPTSFDCIIDPDHSIPKWLFIPETLSIPWMESIIQLSLWISTIHFHWITGSQFGLNHFYRFPSFKIRIPFGNPISTAFIHDYCFLLHRQTALLIAMIWCFYCFFALTWLHFAYFTSIIDCVFSSIFV